MSEHVSINAQIRRLTICGLEEIRRHLSENGNIYFGDECNRTACYINDDGYAESAYYERIELDDNGEISVLLSDGFWLYEDDITANHAVDLLTLIEEIKQP